MRADPGDSTSPSAVKLLAEVSNRVVVLETLDMETTRDDSNLVAAILARIEDAVGRFTAPPRDRDRRAKDQPTGFFEHNEDALLDLQRLQTDLALGWDGMLRERAPHLQTEPYATEVRRMERARLSLNDRFYRALEKIAEQGFRQHVKDPLFVLPIDDFDLNPTRCTELLRLLRMISVPRLFVVVLGDVRVPEVIFNLAVRREMGRVAGTADLPSDSEASAVALQIAASAMRKLVPPHQRITISAFLLAGHPDTSDHVYEATSWLEGAPRRLLDLWKGLQAVPGAPNPSAAVIDELVESARRMIAEEPALSSEARERLRSSIRRGAQNRWTFAATNLKATTFYPVRHLDVGPAKLRLRWAEDRRLVHREAGDRTEHELSKATGSAITIVHDLFALGDGGDVEEVLVDQQLDLASTVWPTDTGRSARVRWGTPPLDSFWQLDRMSDVWRRAIALVTTATDDPLGASAALAFAWIALSTWSVTSARFETFSYSQETWGTLLGHVQAAHAQSESRSHRNERIRAWLVQLACLLAPECGLPEKATKPFLDAIATWLAPRDMGRVRRIRARRAMALLEKGATKVAVRCLLGPVLASQLRKVAQRAQLEVGPLMSSLGILPSGAEHPLLKALERVGGSMHPVTTPTLLSDRKEILHLVKSLRGEALQLQFRVGQMPATIAGRDRADSYIENALLVTEYLEEIHASIDDPYHRVEIGDETLQIGDAEIQGVAHLVSKLSGRTRRLFDLISFPLATVSQP